MENVIYYLGLDIGTNSVGYAVADAAYSLKKFKGEPAWGVTLFDEANLNAERRSFRVSRRRIDRRQQRVQLIQELFAQEIQKVDPRFYIRMHESRLLRTDTDSRYTIFDEAGFTDSEYNTRYPTIHHLIHELMTNDEPHDIRLVYLACAWLVAHRGHFLSDVSIDNVAGLTDFSSVWNGLTEYIEASSDDVSFPWNRDNEQYIGDALKGKSGVTSKYKRLCSALFANTKAPKLFAGFPYHCEAFLKALCGAKISAQTLFDCEEYKEISSFSLGDPDEKLDEVLGQLGDDAELIVKMKAVYDWALLVDILAGQSSISAAKIKVYEQHKSDLQALKYVVKKYAPDQYDVIFKKVDEKVKNYPAYSAHCSNKLKRSLKKVSKEDFSDYIRKNVLEKINPDAEDEALFHDIVSRLVAYSFLPKQRDVDNRVIPYQLYWHELNTLLHNAANYLPFLAEKDTDGLSVSEKIQSVFTFKIPYYVGPLNAHSQNAWIVRKAEGRILPWNFDRLVDRDLSEKEFIRRMTNTCTYLPDQNVLPRESLAYHRFTVLNEINNLKIDGEPIPVSVKQAIYTNLFEQKRKVSCAAIRSYLISNGFMTAKQSISGVDTQIHSDLKSYHDFKRMLTNGILTVDQVEEIIERITCTEDRMRLKKWLREEYSFLSFQDVDYIARLNYKDFGRLSDEFLSRFEGIDIRTGEVTTVLRAMWETNLNLMELLSQNYSFSEEINKRQREYYADRALTLDQRLTEMRLSNAVKRPVLRALEITKEVVKAFGTPPAKIFIEMARGGTDEQKNKRTKSRKQQLMELYSKCEGEDTRELSMQLEAMGDSADTLLQSDRLFLYYAQLGRCMYSGNSIDLNLLAGSTYNIEHIYPRAYVKDDSIINNEVLVLSELNGQKSDDYPINAEIRTKMRPFWDRLKRYGLLSDEKYRRLTRSTSFTDDEKLGFINRQLTETTQSTKAVTEILKEYYPSPATEIVFVKARLTSEFRQTFDLLKSRTFNDLHHAKDAYLNIVTGNVYDTRFSKRWFDVHNKYSVKTETLFTRPVICNGKTVWDGTSMLEKVKNTVKKNNAHMTKYAFCKKGGLFDQLPVKAAEGLVPLKKGLPTEKYGGYNKPAVSFFIPVRYSSGKKKDVMIMPVELMFADRFLADDSFAINYAADKVSRILGKPAANVSFPLGKRIIKINTVLSLDGFRVCIAGSASGGRCLIAAPFMSFSESHDRQTYIKHLEVLTEKAKKNPKHIYDPKYDKVTAEENTALYDVYIEKLKHSVFAKRPNNPIKTLEDGRSQFISLDPVAQAEALLNIHQIFGRISNGTDLTAVGGTARAAATGSFSTNISNWSKNYSDVRIVDASASGLWEKQSENLLSLL